MSRTRPPVKPIVWTLLTIIGLTLCFFIVSNWTHLKSFPQILSAFYAKKYCSCVYVMEQSEDFCHDWSRQWLPISNFSQNSDERIITVSGLGYTTQAQWLSPREGCQLQSTRFFWSQP